METHRIKHIDVWRFFAIMLVLVCHLFAYSHLWYKDVMPSLVWRLREVGIVGVQIFFCISGYVICRGMMREHERTGAIDMRAFYLRRAYRIVPPLFLFIGFILFLTAAGILHVPVVDAARSAAFLCNWRPLGACDWALGHTWSLAYEEQFYLVFPLLCATLLLFMHRARLLALAIALAMACALAYMLSAQFVGIYCGHFFCILCGCLFALYQDQIQPRLARLPVPLWLLIVGIVPVDCMFDAPPVLRELVYPLMLPVVMCVAVFGTPTRHPLVNAIFTHPTLSYVGRISYSIYLWQQAATINYGFVSPLPAVALLAGVFILAHYSFHYVEQPILAWGARHIAGGADRRAPPVDVMDLDADEELRA